MRPKYNAFILLENPLGSDFHIDYMRLLGASQARGREDNAGMFGSGWLYSLALMARHDILDGVKVTIDKDVFTFEVVQRPGSGLSEIVLKQQNGATTPLNINTDYGVVDWDDLNLAFREFLTNALDATMRVNGSYEGFKLELIKTEGKQRPTRAKAGTVRVYLPAVPEFMSYYNHRFDYFPCMAPGWSKDQKIWNNDAGTHARIFRKGVLVFAGDTESLFHYNVNDITINEARKVDSGAAREAAAKVLCRAEVPTLVRFLKGMLDLKRDYFERDVDHYYLNPDNWLSGRELETAKANWNRAAQLVMGANTVIVDSDFAADAAKAKGYEVARLPENITPALKAVGANSADKILSADELAGRATEPAPGWLMETFDHIWRHAHEFNMTRDRKCPFLKAFTVPNDTSDFYKDAIINRDEYIISLNNKNLGDPDLARAIMTQALGYYCTDAGYLESNAVARWVAKFALRLMAAPVTMVNRELPAPTDPDIEAMAWV